MGTKNLGFKERISGMPQLAVGKDYHNQTYESAIVAGRNNKAPGGEPVLCELFSIVQV
jgi:hypothetical protein